MNDDDVPQVRNRKYHGRYGHTRDRIETLRVLRWAGRFIRCHWRFAAAELIHRSAPRTVRAAARGCETDHRRRRTRAERKQQSDKNHGERTHAFYRSQGAQYWQ